MLTTQGWLVAITSMALVAAGRLFGMKMNGRWITVGTPDAIPAAEAAVAGALAKAV